MNQWEPEANTSNRRQARENASSDEVAIGYSFASDWSSMGREIFKPITERSEKKN